MLKMQLSVLKEPSRDVNAFMCCFSSSLTMAHVLSADSTYSGSLEWHRYSPKIATCEGQIMCDVMWVAHSLAVSEANGGSATIFPKSARGQSFLRVRLMYFLHSAKEAHIRTSLAQSELIIGRRSSHMCGQGRNSFNKKRRLEDIKD